MESSDAANKDYPPRRFQEGKTPIRHRRMNHNCFLVNISVIKEELGEDVWQDLHKSPLGVISKFCEIHFTFWAQVIHYFLTHQLVTSMDHELWTLIQGRPIRFSLNEFAQLTQLNCEPFSDVEQAELSHADFWQEIGVPVTLGPCYDDLIAVFPKSKFWSFEKRRMIAWLSILCVVVFGVSHATRIPLEYAKLVLDEDRFKRFPWGRMSFSCLLDGIKMADFASEGKTYYIRGFVHVLHIWALESVPVLGDAYGKRRKGEEVPLLSYCGSRPHIDWPKLIEMDKTNHGQLRVRNLVVKPAEELYPLWNGKKDKDTKVEKLIEDILLNQVDLDFWNEENIIHSTKKIKRGSQSKQNDEDSVVMKQKTKTKSDLGASGSEEVAKETNGGLYEVHGCLKPTTDPIMTGLVKLVESLGRQVLEMNEKLGLGLNAVIDSRIEASFGPLKEKLEQQIAALQDEVNRLREKLTRHESKEATTSDAQSEEEENSKVSVKKGEKTEAVEKSNKGDSRSNEMPLGANGNKVNFEDIPLVTVFKKNTVGGKKQTVKKPVVKELESKGLKKDEEHKSANEDKEKREVKEVKQKKGVKKVVIKQQQKEKEIVKKPEVKPQTKPKLGRQEAHVKHRN